MKCRICNSMVDFLEHHLLTIEESREIAYKLLDVYDVVSKAKNRKITSEALVNSIHKFCGKNELCESCHRRYHRLDEQVLVQGEEEC